MADEERGLFFIWSTRKIESKTKKENNQLSHNLQYTDKEDLGIVRVAFERLFCRC